MEFSKKRIAVLLPCRNEELTIGNLVEGFLKEIPDSKVYVYDNASTDATTRKALEAGAKVGFEATPGKGRVLRKMFADIDADVYVIADGDGTYDPSEAPLMIKELIEGSYDMVAGARTNLKTLTRRGHSLGNRLFNRLYRFLFTSEFSDIFTGYRVLSKRLVKSFPAVSSGFEIETELAVHASQLRLPTLEVPITYGERPTGSASKLRTFSDGFRILGSMLALLKENRPLFLFGSLSTISLLASIILAIPLLATYADTGLVPRVPTVILSTALILLSLLCLISGLILDSLAKARVEAKKLVYLQIESSQASN